MPAEFGSEDTHEPTPTPAVTNADRAGESLDERFARKTSKTALPHSMPSSVATPMLIGPSMSDAIKNGMATSLTCHLSSNNEYVTKSMAKP